MVKQHRSALLPRPMPLPIPLAFPFGLNKNYTKYCYSQPEVTPHQVPPPKPIAPLPIALIPFSFAFSLEIFFCLQVSKNR